MNGSTTQVTASDLRLTLIGLEDWLHEIRMELQVLPETQIIAEVDPQLIPPPPVDPLASPADPEIVRFMRASGAIAGCGAGLPEVSPTLMKGTCSGRSWSRRAIHAQHLARALARVGWLAQVCSFLFAQMPKDEVIRPEIQ